MRKLAILIVGLAGVVLASYFLFFQRSEPTPVPEPAKKQTDRPKPVPNKRSPVFEPSKFHPLKHYNGPKNRYADDYFKNENLREELHEDREELADTLRRYDRYNHYDYHDEYQDAYDNYYYDDEYFYRDYYDYMYPQFEDWEWEHLNSVYSDRDVNDYLKEERVSKKSDKGGDKAGISHMNFPATKANAAQAKLADPVVKKEQNLKNQFVENKKASIAKIAPNTARTFDLFLAEKKPDKKFDIFGTHPKETFTQALTEDLRKQLLAHEILITDRNSEEVVKLFDETDADEKKSIIAFKYEKLESEITDHAGESMVVVVKASLLFGDDGLLRHLLKDGYTIQRYKKDLSLEKYESPGPG